MKQLIKITTAMLMIGIAGLNVPMQASHSEFHAAVYDRAQSSLKYALIGTGILLTPTIYQLIQLRHQKRILNHKKHLLHTRRKKESAEHSILPIASQRIASVAFAPLPHAPVHYESQQREELDHNIHTLLSQFLQTDSAEIQQKEHASEAAFQAKTAWLAPFLKWERPWNWLSLIYSPSISRPFLNPIWWVALGTLAWSTSITTKLLEAEMRHIAFTHNYPALFMFLKNKIECPLALVLTVGATLPLMCYIQNKWEQSATRAHLERDSLVRFETAEQARIRLPAHPDEEPAALLNDGYMSKLDGNMRLKAITCGLLGYGVASTAMSVGLMLYSKYAANNS